MLPKFKIVFKQFCLKKKKTWIRISLLVSSDHPHASFLFSFMVHLQCEWLFVIRITENMDLLSEFMDWLYGIFW